MKEITQIPENTPNRKSIIINIVRASFGELKRDLKRSGVYMNKLKKVKAVELFCDKHDLKDVPRSRKDIDRWLVELWLDESFELLQPKRDRNYTIGQWRILKEKVFRKYGRICMCCKGETEITVDHVKPYRDFPELSLEFTNMQVLCRSCNSRKGAKIKDYR